MATVQAGGHRLEYEWIHPNDQGQINARVPTLVFLHEGLGCMKRWKTFPNLVVQATGKSALIYSRYGHGKSDRLMEPRKADYMHREALDTLPEVLKRLDISNPILIGHSDGASISLIHAGAGEWPVRALVLMAPHVFVEELTLRSIAESKDAFETTDLEMRLARYHDDAAGTFFGWNSIWLHPTFKRWNIEAYLPAIRCPLLIVQCQDDPYGTIAQVDAIVRQVRGPAETCILRECAHSPHGRQTQRTVRAIKTFIDAIADSCLARQPPGSNRDESSE